MADHTAEPRITLHPHYKRVRILDGDTLIVDIRHAILKSGGVPDYAYTGFYLYR